ncbi:winged helix-turn-helix domain-containing protein [Serratia proteamaculans]
MLYTIEERILFRTDDGALWDKYAEDKKIILTPIVSRLLHLFFQEQGTVLTREKIMNKVWEDYGLEPSNNSLNQYVSQIRKVMGELGLKDDVICTIPRVGFTLSSELKLVSEEYNLTTLYEFSDEVIKSEDVKDKFTTRRLVLMTCLILLIAIPFLARFISEKIHYHEMVVSPVLIGQIGSCKIYSLMKGDKGSQPKILLLANYYVNENKITCNENDFTSSLLIAC